MKENIFIRSLGLVAIISAIFLTALFLVWNTQKAQSAAPGGFEAKVASSTTISVSAAGVGTLFASTTGCIARVVTVLGDVTGGIMLTFSDYRGQSPTAFSGHYQAASTTEVYDSAIYGCGKVKAYSFTAGTTTVSETTW